MIYINIYNAYKYTWMKYTYNIIYIYYIQHMNKDGTREVVRGP